MDHHHPHLIFTIYTLKQSITGLAKRALITWSPPCGLRMARDSRHLPICCCRLTLTSAPTTPMCQKASHPRPPHRDCCHPHPLLATWIWADPFRWAIVLDPSLIADLRPRLRDRYQMVWTINANGVLLISKSWAIKPSISRLISTRYVSIHVCVAFAWNILIICVWM